MSINIGALPNLPDPDTILSDADLVAASGARAEQYGTDLVAIWDGIQAHYQAPEGAQLYEAMRPVTNFTNEAAIVTSLIKGALSAFAEEVRQMKQEHANLMAAASASYPESTDDDPDNRENKEAEINADIAALAQRYATAEETCAAAIRIADPAQVPGTPGFTDTPAYKIADATAENIFERVRRTRVDISATVQVRSLSIGTVFVTYADGTTVPVTRVTLTSTTQELRYTRNGLNFDPNVGISHLPGWARTGGKVLGVFGSALSIHENVAEQWNEDLIDHPEYSTGQRIGSAAKNVVFESGFSAAGSALFMAGGAALGTAIFPGVGTVIGGAVGSWLGGAVGEGVGSFLQDVTTEGKSAGDAIHDAAKEFLNSLW